jgi:hypothetical protein
MIQTRAKVVILLPVKIRSELPVTSEANRKKHLAVQKLDENIQVTIGDGAANPAFLMKSEDESSSFTFARDTKVTLKAEKLTLLT